MNNYPIDYLDDMRAYFGFNPMFFYQLTNSKLVPLADCDQLVREYAWQNADRIGRSEIRQAILDAEETIRRLALFSPVPRYREFEVRYPELGDKRFVRRGQYSSIDEWLTVTLPEGRILSCGVPVETTPESVALTYSDNDGDTIIDTATCTSTVPAGTLPANVVVRLQAADCGTLVDLPEIAPENVTVSGTTATITIAARLLVRPARYIGVAPALIASNDPNIVPPTVGTPYVANVDVLVRTINQDGTTVDDSQVLFIWEAEPYPTWACCTNDPGSVRYGTGRAIMHRAYEGKIGIASATYDSDTATWSSCSWQNCRPPDRVRIRYYAGIDRIRWRPDPFVRDALYRLASAYMARPICACTQANAALQEWQTDLSLTGSTNALYAQPDDITNPIGSRRGHVFAWRFCQDQYISRGIYAG